MPKNGNSARFISIIGKPNIDVFLLFVAILTEKLQLLVDFG